jgi:hypothetical protein
MLSNYPGTSERKEAILNTPETPTEMARQWLAVQT